MVLICLFDLWGELSPGIHNCEATPPLKKIKFRGGVVYYCGPNIMMFEWFFSPSMTYSCLSLGGLSSFQKLSPFEPAAAGPAGCHRSGHAPERIFLGGSGDGAGPREVLRWSDQRNNSAGGFVLTRLEQEKS